MKGKILKACHDTPLARRLGFYKTYKQLRECQQNKASSMCYQQVITAFAHSKLEMREYIYGFHHKITKGPR